MVVTLPQGVLKEWLRAPLEGCMELLQSYPADRLTTQP